MKIIKQYENYCNEIVLFFCKKHDLTDGYWIGGQIGGIYDVADMSINFRDIVYDLKSEQPKEMFTKWYYEGLDRALDGKEWMNYCSYTKGLKYKD